MLRELIGQTHYATVGKNIDSIIYCYGIHLLPGPLQQTLSQWRHILGAHVHFDEHRIVSDIIQFVQNGQFAKLLRSERCIAFAGRSSQEWTILLARVGLDGVGDILAAGRILTLIQKRERDAMTERPRQEGVVFALTHADVQRHVLAAG